MKDRFLLLLVLVALTTQVVAQSKFHFFGGPGVNYVQGDFTETGLPHPLSLKFSGKLGAGYDFHPRFGVRIHGTYSQTHGSDFYTTDEGKHKRGGSFYGTIIDAGVTFKVRKLFGNNYRFMNYLYFGVDYFNMKSQVSYAGNENQPVENTYNPHQVNLPFGIGLGYWINTNFGLAVESTYHITFTDYVDGVSLAGNPQAMDTFFDSHLLLIYRFGKKRGGKAWEPRKMGGLSCPRF